MKLPISFIISEILAISITISMTPKVKGPEFLLFYFFLWILLVPISQVLKWKVILPIMIFASAGIVRYIVGKYHGMMIFDYLWFSLLGGSVLFVIVKLLPKDGKRTSSSGSYYHNSGCSSSSCGSGCGSGGGGGGCGGCGGD